MDVDDEVTRLQGSLAEAVAHARSLPEDDARHGPAADEAIDLARRLVDLEERLPTLRDVGPHRTTLILVRSVVGLLILAAAGLAVGWATDRLALVWLLLVPVLAWVALVTFLPSVPSRPPAAHRRHRAPAVLALAGGGCVVLAACGVTAWLVPAGSVLLLVGGLRAWRLRENRTGWDGT